MIAIFIFLPILLTVLIYIHSLAFFQIMQLNMYISSEYEAWLKNFGWLKNALKKLKPGDKKPLVFTDRMKRMMKIFALFNVIIMYTSIIAYLIFGEKIALAYLLVLAFLLYIIRARSVKCANILALPIENKINHGFYVEAQNKIKKEKENKLKVVGITGSYGKTSTKLVLNDIVKNSLKTYATPSSFNTPMGISKVINNELDSGTEVFISELGARYVGEIKEVADLVMPDIAIITNIGPCHIETFGSMENIVKTKFELIDSLKEGGLAIFNYDNPYIKEKAAEVKTRKVYISLEDDACDYFAKDISVGEFGTEFTLIYKNNEYKLKTKLLGKHNIYNVLLSVAAAHELGMSMEDVVKAVLDVNQVEHRLSLVENPNNLIIIDDAFNSNPSGAQAALDVISEFKEGKKIVISPGMVELGDLQYEENKKFGKNAAALVDHFIIVAEVNKKAVKDGLIDGGLDERFIHEAASLSDAQLILQKICQAGDVILFENDLPDNY